MMVADVLPQKISPENDRGRDGRNGGFCLFLGLNEKVSANTADK